MTHILFVDDEKNILDGYRKTLHRKKGDWRLHFCDSVDLALEEMQKFEMDIVLTDVSMPGKSGFDLLKQIKEIDRYVNVSVVLITGLSETQLKSKAMDLGADDLLSKPVDTSELLSRIKNLLRLKRYKDELSLKNHDLQSQLIRMQRIEMTGTLAIGCVHDLRNLLSAIFSLAELANTEKNSLYLDKLGQSCDTAIVLTEQILSATRSNFSDDEVFELITIVKKCVDIIKVTKSTILTISLTNTCDNTYIKGNPVEIYQVLMNLIINAVHAFKTEDGYRSDGKIDISISSSQWPDDSQESSEERFIRIDVKDNGCGISNESLDKIFEPLFTTKADDQGTGIGLSVVHYIMEKYKGRILAKSEAGRGTEFSLYFPKLKSKTESTSPASNQDRVHIS